MTFGETLVDDAAGAIAAHGVRAADVVIHKGAVVTEAHVAALKAAGVATIFVARLEDGDVGEDVAAHALARACAGPGVRVDAPFAGRANLRATHAGVVLAPVAGIDAVNAVDEAITLATLAPFAPAAAGDLIATVKIIPFAAPRADLARALACAPAARLAVAPYRGRAVAVLCTRAPGLKEATITKTLRALQDRLTPMDGRITFECRPAHAIGPLTEALRAAAGADLTIVFGASATADRRDVVPAAIEAAGGRIEAFGMPVDPGNLLALARNASGAPVLGAPGCARSPKENGFDFVLRRLMADLPVTGADLQRMGAGGLLKEIGSRPQPRSRTGRDGTGDG